MMTSVPSVLVIGGGIIGCSAAHELAKRGCRVTVLERGTPGGEASSAAAGLLAPLGDSPDPSPFNRLAIESWRLYPRIVAELREATGVDVEHMTAGTLYPLASPADVEDARAQCGWPLAAEFGVELVEGGALAALEPALAKDVTAALLVRGDHWVNNQRLVTAYALAAAARGATVRTGVEVGRILVEHGRAVGVLADGVQRTHASLPVAALREITPPGFLIGASAHSTAEAREAAAQGADFVVFGPVYDTPSKRGYGPPQGLAALEAAAAAATRPVLAVGGITPERVGEVRAAGAAGVAVIGAIYGAARPADATKAFLDVLGSA